MPTPLSKLFKAATKNILSQHRDRSDRHSDDLKTTAVQETETSAVQPVRLKPEPSELVRPPKELHINPIIGRPYFQYYGYAIPHVHEWLIRFAEKECPEVLPERDHICYKVLAMVRAREHISARSGFWWFELKFCFNPKDGPVPPLWFDAFMAKYFKSGTEELRAVQIDTVPVFAVCSERDESFNERPTQEQMDIITKLIGYPPQWWVCCDYD